MNSTEVSNVRAVYDNSVNKNLKTNVHRPQSPRQFFERIYGHLEHSSNNNEVDVNIIKPISPLASEISSSPDLIDRKHHLVDSSGLENPLDIGFNMQHMGSMNFLSPSFNQFRPILGLTDHHLPAGLTAFHECTSAVSVDVEGSMYQYCKKVGITLFTVSHRKSLWKHHEHYLQFDGRGSYVFEPIDSTKEQFGS